MRALVVALILLLAPVAAGRAAAQVIAVKSGEHDTFTRLVLETGAPVGWTMGRTTDGYELRLDRDGVRFDLSQVYRLIPRRRLAAIWVDPASGRLRLGIGCACHALPFEFRPGIIVIDLRNGSPPPGSSFELALEDKPPAPSTVADRPHPDEGVLPDWKADAATSPTGDRTGVGLPLPAATADLSRMRDSLLRQMSDGAARGVVEMTAPPPREGAAPAPIGPLRQIRAGENIGFAADTSRRLPLTLTGEGTDCLPDDRLDIAAWGREAPVADQMAPARAGLTGEFDRPDPGAVSRAVRFYLYLGFGREARQLLDMLDAAPPDRAVWETMAIILDEGSALEGPFAAMQVCDTAAALWSVLARPHLSGAATPNKAAVLHGFSALPLHLRRHLGPALSERFLKTGDGETARALRDAALRAPGDPGPAVRLMAAELDLAQGDGAAAERSLQALASGGGPTAAAALVTYVEAMIDQGKPLDPETVTAVAALAQEYGGTDIGRTLHETHVLALAASGDFDAAFARPQTAPETRERLWRILAVSGPDTALLAHGVLPETARLPELPLELRRKLAERSLGLGFAAPAMRWLPDVTEAAATASDADRMLAARAEMKRGDARAALRLLAGLGGPGAEGLKAEAQAQLGDLASVIGLFAALGNQEAEQRAARIARDWRSISARGEDPWRAAAALVVRPGGGKVTDAGTPSTPEASPGPLARSRQALEESAAARAVLLALLAQVPAETGKSAPEN